jgi:hypothetical protein
LIDVAASEEVDGQAFQALLVTPEECEKGVLEDIFTGRVVINEEVENQFWEVTLGEESTSSRDALQMQHCKVAVTVMVRILWISLLPDFQLCELREVNPGRRALEVVQCCPNQWSEKKIGHALNNIVVDVKVESKGK